MASAESRYVGGLGGWSFFAACVTRTTVATRAPFAIATLAWGCIDTFGYPLGQASNTLIGFVLGQVTSSDMLLDVCGLRFNDCVDNSFDGDTLIGGDISDALAGVTCCFEHLFADTKCVGEHCNALGTTLSTLFLASFALLFGRRVLRLGNAWCNSNCAQRSDADHAGSDRLLHS